MVVSKTFRVCLGSALLIAALSCGRPLSAQVIPIPQPIPPADYRPTPEKLCEQRGKFYVTEKNMELRKRTREEFAPESGRSFDWSFIAAHYDSHTNTCYVMYNRLVRVLGTTLEQIKIDDIEGSNHIAGYSATWASDHSGYPTYTRPRECIVNGISCESKAEFESLLGKLVPSFGEKIPRGRGPGYA
jgi:hypothetical protein